MPCLLQSFPDIELQSFTMLSVVKYLSGEGRGLHAELSAYPAGYSRWDRLIIVPWGKYMHPVLDESKGMKRQRATLGCILLLMVVSCPLFAISASSEATQQVAPPQNPSVSSEHQLSFEVASIRLNKTDDKPYSNFPLGSGSAYAVTGGRFRATNLPLLVFITFAYRLTSDQETAIERDGPRWLVSENFDIDAKSESSTPTKDEMRKMMQALLQDRFALQMHKEIHQSPIFTLELARVGVTGRQLQPHPLDEVCSSTSKAKATDAEPAFLAAKGGAFPLSCGGIAEHLRPSVDGRLRVGARAISMQLLADTLPRLGNLGRPVIEDTGLKGVFDFILEWSPHSDNGSFAEQQSPSTIDGPGFEEALRAQLGLKLVKKNGPVEGYILDHVDQPSPN